MTLEKSELTGFGSTALNIGGGNRKTLELSFNRVRDCEFSFNSRYHRVGPTVLYADGVDAR